LIATSDAQKSDCIRKLLGITSSQLTKRHRLEYIHFVTYK